MDIKLESDDLVIRINKEKLKEFAEKIDNYPCPQIKVSDSASFAQDVIHALSREIECINSILEDACVSAWDRESEGCEYEIENQD